MSPPPRHDPDQLCRQALDLLRRIGYDVDSVRVSVSTLDGSVRVVFTSNERGEPDSQGRRPGNNAQHGDVKAEWLLLSPAEQCAVVALGKQPPGSWTKGSELAAACDEEYDAGFRRLLRNLVERGLLESSPGRGYRLRLANPC